MSGFSRSSSITPRRSAASEVVIVSTVNPELVTPLSDSFQAVVWHCLVTHPALKRNRTKW